jgi:putative ABC transport system permease protein
MSLRRSMFFHLLKRGLLGRGDRPLIAFIALAVASTMITAMLNLYDGLENKLTRDFRSYGANATVATSGSQSLNDDAIVKAKESLPKDAVLVPFAFAIARTSKGVPVIVAGTNMAQAQRLDTWWGVTRWPNGSNEALVGIKAESQIGAKAESFTLDFDGRALQLNEVGILKTGADEENRIYVPLAAFEGWTGVKPSLLEVSAPGTRDNVQAVIEKLQAALPGMQVRPVRQLLAAEGAVIGRMRSVMLACTILIALTAMLCVFSTLTSSVLERRRDFAVMKAIGSSQTTVNILFAAEALSIAFIAACSGYVLGSGLAAWISQANFHAAVAPQIQTLPWVILVSMILAFVAALLPLAQLQRIEPAGILKGE